MRETLFATRGLACGRDGRTIVGRVDLALETGEILFLLGPNGAGKTTLLQTLLRRLLPLSGQIFLGGANVAKWSAAQYARSLAYVPQSHRPLFPFSVFDMVLMGRAAHHGALAAPSQADRALAEEALAGLGVAGLRNRPVTEISGGERQLALLARALAQNPKVLILDEPTANLDFGNQISVLDHVRALARRKGLGVIVAAHDPNQALAYADRVGLIGRNGGFGCGAPGKMVTADWLEQTYGVATRIVPPARPGEPAFCLPMRRAEEKEEESRCAG